MRSKILRKVLCKVLRKVRGMVLWKVLRKVTIKDASRSDPLKDLETGPAEGASQGQTKMRSTEKCTQIKEIMLL